MTGAGRRRVCLLTGASGLLGTAFCRRYADRYDIVAIHNRHVPELVSQTATLVDPLAPHDELAENRHAVFSVRADLTREEDVRRLVDVALTRFGRIDVVVNAAAWSTRQSALDERTFTASLERHFATNVVAPARLSVAVARACWQDRPDENRAHNRNVVNVSSTAGIYLYPGLDQAAYATSKAALNFLTIHLASELGGIGVRANVTAPNGFPHYVPTERVLESIVAFDDGRMTGQILMLDAGEELVL